MSDVESPAKDKITRKMVSATKIFSDKGDCLFYQSFLTNCATDTSSIGQVDMYYGPDGTLLGLVRTDDEGFPVEVELILP